MGDSKNFTVENGIYKGRVTNLDNYKSFGELIWINIRKHGDKIARENIVNMTNLRLLWFSPLYWMSGLLLNLYAIIDGATAILYPEFDEEMTCRLIEKYKIELVYLPTIMINQFLREDYITKYSLSSLSVVLCGGMALRPKIQEKLRRNLPHAQILQGYGKYHYNA
ncbi:4-coumarate--CoA ligase-like 9 [Pogonomyrmex barbatus]|uniref:4-coumarate--CoA ligase-like 9 n=1 Tax=Pogonomyrmex barbatus TaxID=144034 RepID=A0A6I9VVT4_9HYME|nr:4-coumarate--CoA ligase-like 9 [Pogonomyrmex barbatus]